MGTLIRLFFWCSRFYLSIRVHLTIRHSIRVLWLAHVCRFLLRSAFLSYNRISRTNRRIMLSFCLMCSRVRNKLAGVSPKNTSRVPRSMFHAPCIIYVYIPHLSFISLSLRAHPRDFFILTFARNFIHAPRRLHLLMRPFTYREVDRVESPLYLLTTNTLGVSANLTFCGPETRTLQ